MENLSINNLHLEFKSLEISPEKALLEKKESLKIFFLKLLSPAN